MSKISDYQIPALMPNGRGHQFVLYGDACSGVPGALHEQTFASVNSVVRRLQPQPEFIVFTGDEVIGLTADQAELEAQWQHWLKNEMAWLDRNKTPIWHCTGNHTTYNQMSERVFREALELPQNGPSGQEGLSYWVRRDDVLMVFVHTLWSGLGGEAYVEANWLEQTLRSHADANHKFVVGHHPAFPVNGFAGDYQRTIAPECVERFWDVLINNEVTAYLCSHILAYDVQVQRGVLQICTAGAGTAHRMPEGDEYLHAVQVALDDGGLRLQVLDTDGLVREKLTWPRGGWSFSEPELLENSQSRARNDLTKLQQPLRFQISGLASSDGHGVAQTLIACGEPDALPSLWIGLRGMKQRLTVIVGNTPGRSPHFWLGPEVSDGARFAFELLLHSGMGPGGLLCRNGLKDSWTSLSAASSWGLERLLPAPFWCVGESFETSGRLPFRGDGLEVLVSTART